MGNFENPTDRESQPSIEHSFIEDGSTLEISINEFTITFYQKPDSTICLRSKSNASKKIGSSYVPDHIYTKARKHAEEVFKKINPAQHELDLKNAFLTGEAAQNEIDKIKKMLRE